MLAGVQKLRRWVLEDFGLDVVELSPVGHGADVAAQVWRAATTSNTYAVKWSGAGTNTGHQVAAYLADSGLPGIPELIRTIDGGIWSFHGKKHLTITPWIDGARGAETGLTTEQWTEYGVLLRRVHSSEPPERLRDALPRHSPVDARIPALADYLPRVHLIDWDDVVLAHREQDLMFMLGGMGSLGPTTDEQLDAFFNGYGDHELDEAALAYYRCARALEDVALWAEQVLTGPDRAESLEILRGVLSPSGLAVRALF